MRACPAGGSLYCRTPNGIRTRAAGVKGRCPGPLDDGGQGVACPRKDSNLRPPAPEAGALSPELRGRETGVNDGARTRDLLDHNQALCQLSYTHHAAHATFVRRRLEPDTGIDPVTSFLPRTRSATELIGRCYCVPPAGLEPATSGLEGRHSIQLSYGGVTAPGRHASGRRDSNSRHPLWKSGALPLSYSRIWYFESVTGIEHRQSSELDACPDTRIPSRIEDPSGRPRRLTATGRLLRCQLRHTNIA